MTRTLAFPALMLLSSLPAHAAAPISGHWLTNGGESIVEIAPCGSALCGHVAKVLKGNSANPRMVDLHNPDLKARNRSIVGLTILSGLTDGGSVWNGRVYDPKSGKSYRSELSREANGTLLVKGCIGPFCRKLVWTAAR